MTALSRGSLDLNLHSSSCGFDDSSVFDDSLVGPLACSAVFGCFGTQCQPHVAISHDTVSGFTFQYN